MQQVAKFTLVTRIMGSVSAHKRLGTSPMMFEVAYISCFYNILKAKRVLCNSMGLSVDALTTLMVVE